MKLVFEARDSMEAHLVRGLLESHGLGAEVRGETLAGDAGELPFVEVWPTVWIHEDDRDLEARSIIAESGRASSGQAPDAGWSCRKCGERVEPQFTACWACGNDRPRDENG